MKMNLQGTSRVVRAAILALLGLILAAMPALSEGTEESAVGEVKKLNLALGDIETVETLHLLIALEKVKERGIDVEMISFKSEDVAAQAVVNKQADIGISLPGTGETPAAPVFIDGKKAMTLRGPNIAVEFKRIVEDYIERRFGPVSAGLEHYKDSA